MKTTAGMSLLLVLVAVIAQAWGAADQPKNATKEELTIEAFMHRKLELSQKAMEGIVNEDYELIRKSAVELEKMGGQKEWKVIPGDEYTHFVAEFRRSAKSMAKQAEQKNVDGSAMAYMQLTMSCVECHKFTRRTRVASVNPVH